MLALAALVLAAAAASSSVGGGRGDGGNCWGPMLARTDSGPQMYRLCHDRDENLGR